MLLITSSLLAFAHFIKKRERQISYLDALLIGIAQAVAVIPGISRSGATIATGLLIGNKKDEIARFSFLMVLIPVLGANILELISFENNMNGKDVFAIIIGSIAAFISGYRHQDDRTGKKKQTDRILSIALSQDCYLFCLAEMDKKRR